MGLIELHWQSSRKTCVYRKYLAI